MFPRAIYKDPESLDWTRIPDPVGTYKYDGANYWLRFDEQGKASFISRRPSVKGGYPDRTASLPHLTERNLPQLAGHVYNVELIHTGESKDNSESHSVLSGILNSLPPKAIETQRIIGPVRAVLHNVVNPDLPTYKAKLLHMYEVEKSFDNPELLFVATPHVGHEAIVNLVKRTKLNNREGAIITSLTRKEDANPRVKIKHKITYNLKVTSVIQEIDKDGNPKASMGALDVADSSGKVVARVGTGFTRNQRIDAWENPGSWIGKPIQVETMGVAARMLRMPVYNGDADGEVDLVPDRQSI